MVLRVPPLPLDSGYLSQLRSVQSQRTRRILISVIAKKVLQRRTLWRWGVPVAVVAGVAVFASGVLSAGASPNLPDLTAAQLLSAVEQSHVAGFSGQVVETASLGLPELPSLGSDSSGTSLISLLSGSHTARVWYAGPDKQRIALLSTLGETDVFHDGTDLWQWDSNSLTAVHTVLPAAAASQVPAPVQTTALTPDQLAQRAIAAIDPSTTISTDQSRRIAGRAAYDLVLTPRDATSRIGLVRIGIDSQYKLPLSVQVFPRSDITHAAIDVSFSSVDFAVPSDSQFAFTPPKSATIKQQNWNALFGGAGASGAPAGPGTPAKSAPNGGTANKIGSAAAESMRAYGSGWTSVVKLPGTALTASSGTASSEVQALLGSLTPVTGTWGTGRLFSSKLMTVLLVDGGAIYVGAVDPSVIYAAAAQK
jgi:outer membrane lipoprotein-sorting protein